MVHGRRDCNSELQIQPLVTVGGRRLWLIAVVRRCWYGAEDVLCVAQAGTALTLTSPAKTVAEEGRGAHTTTGHAPRVGNIYDGQSARVQLSQTARGGGPPEAPVVGRSHLVTRYCTNVLVSSHLRRFRLIEVTYVPAVCAAVPQPAATSRLKNFSVCLRDARHSSHAVESSVCVTLCAYARLDAEMISTRHPEQQVACYLPALSLKRW